MDNNSVFDEMERNGIRRFEILPSDAPNPNTEWIIEYMKNSGHERLFLFSRPETGLRAAIAIHNRSLGQEVNEIKQTLGGCRMIPYADEKEMLTDVLRLSRAMTYKAAAALVPFGGAKAVIWGDPRLVKTKALLEAIGEEIEKLGGMYITGEDMNINEKDILIMRNKTTYVAGLPEEFQEGTCRGSGDPSPITARGIIWGMKAAIMLTDKNASKSLPLSGKTVAIQGIGKVGFRLARLLFQGENVEKLIVSDKDEGRLIQFKEEFQEDAYFEFRQRAIIVPQEEIFSQECDILAPCAAGGILNEAIIPKLQCKIIAGAANNQLANPEEKLDKIIFEKGIIYVPDYVINAGGLMNVAEERNRCGYSYDQVTAKLKTIYDRVFNILWLSRKMKIPPGKIADALAECEIDRKSRQ